MDSSYTERYAHKVGPSSPSASPQTTQSATVAQQGPSVTQLPPSVPTTCDKIH